MEPCKKNTIGEQIYASGGCNRENKSYSWNLEYDIVAYCGEKVIYQQDIKRNIIVHTQCAHDEVIQRIEWCKECIIIDNIKTYFLISSSLNEIYIWQIGFTNDRNNWQQKNKDTNGIVLYKYIKMDIIKSDSIIDISITKKDSNEWILSTIQSCNNLLLYTIKWDTNIKELQIDTIVSELQILDNNSKVSSVSIVYWEVLKSIYILIGCLSGDLWLYYINNDKILQREYIDKHNDWIQSLDQKQYKDTLLIASGGKDRIIQIYEIFILNIDNITTNDLYIKKKWKVNNNKELLQKKQGILLGHEEIITKVQWSPRDDIAEQVSSGLDNTLIIWHNTAGDTIVGLESWQIETTLTQSGKNGEGMYSVSFGPNGQSQQGQHYNGSFTYWRRITNITNQNKVQRCVWETYPCISGHDPQSTIYGQDIYIDKNMMYILSGGSDQTVRITAPCVRWWYKNNDTVNIDTTSTVDTSADNAVDMYTDNAVDTSTDNAVDRNTTSTAKNINFWDVYEKCPWMEISRPQIHGWDIRDIVQDHIEPHKYWSASEEKVQRIFRAPQPFIGTLFSLVSYDSLVLSKLDNNTNDIDILNKYFIDNIDKRSLSTTRHEQSQTTRGQLQSDNVVQGQQYKNSNDGTTIESVDVTTGQSQIFYNKPPTEKEIENHSLWEEIDKQYFHGNIQHIQSSNNKHIFSVSEALNSRGASIGVWDISKQKLLEYLIGHNSTVTVLVGSPDGEYLQSGSKDRTFILWYWDGKNYIKELQQMAHKRQIVCGGWLNSILFCTVGRENVLKLWDRNTSEMVLSLRYVLFILLLIYYMYVYI